MTRRWPGSSCLNEAIEPLFGEIPAEVDLFDLGISRGETPQLWIDAIAHVAMGRDKRVYRFVQDTRYGRKLLAESVQIPDIVQAVTKYLALRLVERERALDEDPDFITRVARPEAVAPPCAVAADVDGALSYSVSCSVQSRC